MFHHWHALGRVHPARLVLLCGITTLLWLPWPASAQDLTLSSALSRVASADPLLQSNSAQLRAADAAVLQAGVRPQDSVGVDVEDFVGTGPYSSLGQSQTTAWFDRTWERGGKRQARIEAASADTAVVAQRNRLRMLDRFQAVQANLVEAQAAEAAIPAAEQHLQSALAVQAEVNRRVARALDPLFAAERARTAVAEARIALDQARAASQMAKARLAAWWGGPADFELEQASFQHIVPSALKDSAPTDVDVPELALLTSARDSAAARARLAETGNTPDMQARVGLRYFGDGNDVAAVVGGSIPLGSGWANRANVERARAEQSAADAQLAVSRHELALERQQLVATRALVAQEIARIDREVLPSAARALVLVRAGFARGGTAFTFLEISQAQKTLLDARARRVELLRRFHLAGVRLDRLNGQHIPFLSSMETPK